MSKDSKYSFHVKGFTATDIETLVKKINKISKQSGRIVKIQVNVITED